jgi:signal transduction histidine kinase
MTNIVRHSHAGSIRVNIMQQNSGVILYIYDDGRGFDLRNIQMGNGLAGIYTEVKAFDGVVDIVTAPGKGCSVTVLLPI